MNKNSFLLLGYSNIARKRIISVFLKKKIIFSIASKSYKKKIIGAKSQFSNYEDALIQSTANIVYISLPNSLHFYWAKKALLLGYHVVVDKPLCLNMREANILLKIAKKNKKLISESIFYNYHNQIKKIIILAGGIKKIELIKVNFHIPAPSKNSLLMSNKFNGGVIMDMLPYASSINRIFFNERIIKTNVEILRNSTKLPISFKLKVTYKNKKYVGSFKFGGKYLNNITLFTKKKILSIDRVFSPPTDMNLLVNIVENELKKTHIVKQNDCFEKYIIELVSKIKNKKFLYYYNQIKDDQIFRNKVQKKIL